MTSTRSTPPAPPAAPRPRRSEPMARAIAAACLDRKATDVVALDLAGVSDMADYFIIANGTSDTHVRAVAQHVVDVMKAAGHRLAHEDGLSSGRWVVLDFTDVIVHVFHPTLREYYQLERLWGDARPLALDAPGAA